MFEKLLNKVKNKNPSDVIRFLFWPIEICSILFLIAILCYVVYWDYDFSILESFGETFGIASVVFFSITILPGMLIRLGFRDDWTRLLMVYRREFGKLMFIFAFGHYLMFNLIFNFILWNYPTIQFLPYSLPLYQVMGFIALVLSFPLFLTSTNWAQRKLGKYWKILHSLVYVIVWFIFLHVAIVEVFEFISIFLFVLGCVEIFSILNYKFFKIDFSKKFK